MTDEAEFSATEMRRAAAAHEAGHAVVAWALGLNVCRLRIHQDDGKAAAMISDADHLSIKDQIAILLAGTIGQECMGTVIWETAGVADEARVNELLEGLSDHRQTCLRTEGERRARFHLSKCTSLLHAVSDALEIAGEIDRDNFLSLAQSVDQPLAKL